MKTKITTRNIFSLGMLFASAFFASCGGEAPVTENTEECEGQAEYTINGTVTGYVDPVNEILYEFSGVANVSIIAYVDGSSYTIATTTTQSNGVFEVKISQSTFEQYKLIDNPDLEAAVTFNGVDSDGDSHTYNGDGTAELSSTCDWSINNIIIE